VASLRVFGRHQLATVAATTLDYAMMILCVSALGLGPVNGTVVGAASGALASFTLGRTFTFRARHGAVHGQAIRYGLVSVLSLAWNAAGEHLLAVVLGVQYVVARVSIGTVVGIAWNFPMHRHFVFRTRRAPNER
jgi:putative flippase GtrA